MRLAFPVCTVMEIEKRRMSWLGSLWTKVMHHSIAERKSLRILRDVPNLGDGSYNWVRQKRAKDKGFRIRRQRGFGVIYWLRRYSLHVTRCPSLSSYYNGQPTQRSHQKDLWWYRRSYPFNEWRKLAGRFFPTFYFGKNFSDLSIFPMVNCGDKQRRYACSNQ